MRFKTFSTKIKKFVSIDIKDESINDFFYKETKVNGLVFLQDIDLKDRNGKNIHVGDILTLNGSGHYQVKYIAPKYVLADADGDIIFDAKPYFEEREIVGNIYENQNLLK